MKGKVKRRCIKCGKLKHFSNFYITNSKTGQRRTDCKFCNIKDSVKRRKLKPNMVFKHQIKHAYGITIKEYNELLKKQNKKCAICKKKETIKHFNGKIKRLSIDHNHKTGQIRGLLCARCNVGIAYLSENINYLKNAITYLGEHYG